MSLYQKTKKILISIIPRSVLFRHEYFFRSIYYLLYIGNRYQCTICKKNLKSFINTNIDKICPRCGSLKRTRRLWNILNSEFLAGNPRILDFSPSRSIYHIMKKGKYNYIGSDLSGDFLSDVAYDITCINSPDNSYDLIICYHILEHIENDLEAMKEIHRVLKAGGVCLIQTPFQEGEIYEDFSITAPKEREVHFGQNDHVRIYSVEGLKNRLVSAGLQIEIRTYDEISDNIFGYGEKETVLICRKAG